MAEMGQPWVAFMTLEQRKPPSPDGLATSGRPLGESTGGGAFQRASGKRLPTRSDTARAFLLQSIGINFGARRKRYPYVSVE
jgi:hypothetical protein